MLLLLLYILTTILYTTLLLHTIRLPRVLAGARRAPQVGESGGGGGADPGGTGESGVVVAVVVAFAGRVLVVVVVVVVMNARVTLSGWRPHGGACDGDHMHNSPRFLTPSHPPILAYSQPPTPIDTRGVANALACRRPLRALYQVLGGVHKAELEVEKATGALETIQSRLKETRTQASHIGHGCGRVGSGWAREGCEWE